MASKDIREYELPGQFVWQNMLLARAHPVEVINQVTNMELETTDTVVASYPKAGTTLLQELVWLVLHKADVEASQKTPNFIRVPFIDIKPPGPRPTGLQMFSQLPHPRAMKTHVPFNLLPAAVQQGVNKVVYIFRNPKDTLVSYYHFHRMNSGFGNFSGTWDDFFEYFRRNNYLLLYGNPLDHMLCFWEKRHQPNVLLLFYEDLLVDKMKGVRQLVEFLDVELSEEQMGTIVEATTFNSMKSSPSTNYDFEKWVKFAPGQKPPMDKKISPFMRKGEVGDWKNYFNEEQNRIVDEMCEKKLAGTGLTFRFE